MLAGKSLAGEANTIGNVLIQHWAIEHRKSSHAMGRKPHRLLSVGIPLRWNPNQGQALRALMAALIRPQLRGQVINYEGDATNYANNVV